MIELIQTEHAPETMMARRDWATVTKCPVVENPYWFRDGDTGKEYYSLHGCIGWPQRINEKGDQMPGYAAILGILRDGLLAEDAKFLILDEVEDRSEYILIEKCINLRKKWGFGVQELLLDVFTGDYRPFENAVAEFNTRMVEAGTPDREAFIVSPADDFEASNSFDIYMGRLRQVLSEDRKRLYIGDNRIIKEKLMAFRRDDPAIVAMGGLVHTLLIRIPWMQQTIPAVFQVPDN